jgi:phospholipase/lecithinase/hemolysin
MATFSKLFFGASLLSLGLAAPHQAIHNKRQDTTRYLFSFGASYSQSGFDINGVQPTVGNPTGNPAVGTDTFSGGPVFPEYLATTYNNTFTQLYDFAVGGATTSRDIVAPGDASIPTFEDQVNTKYEPKFSTPGGDVPWSSDNAFFTIQFGINDITLSYLTADLSTEIPALLEKYTAVLDNLYSTGARKFMIMGLPPLDRSPFIQDTE